MMNWVKKHPSVLAAAALVLLVAVLLIDSLIVRLPAALLGVCVIIALVLEVVSFIMIRRNFNAELKNSTANASVPSGHADKNSSKKS